MWFQKLALLLCMIGLVANSTAVAQQHGTVTYIYTDPQATPLAEADASGNITATFDYTPYGTTAMGTAPSNPGYTGHVHDSDTAFVYMQARYYDPEARRFLSTDPKVLKPTDLANFDRYGYANGNPIRYIDPDGLYACASQGSCQKITQFVKTMNSALSKLDKSSTDYKALSAVSQHIGTLGDNNGVVLSAGNLAKNVIAQAHSATQMTIDVKQASSLSAKFSQYNLGINATNLTNAFGAEAIAHEGQHQVDYQDPKIGYPTGRTKEHMTELNAYRTEIGVAKGLGISNDLYAPGALQKDVDERINSNADSSTNYWCQRNGC